MNSCEYKRIHTFSKGISPKVNVIKRLNFRLALFQAAVQHFNCPVGWGCRMRRLHLRRGVGTPPPNECPGYDSKQPDGEVPLMLRLWGIRSTPSLPLLPGPLWRGVVAPGRVRDMGQIKLTAY